MSYFVHFLQGVLVILFCSLPLDKMEFWKNMFLSDCQKNQNIN